MLVIYISSTGLFTKLYFVYYRNLFPDNIIQACLQNAKTEIVHEMVEERQTSGPVTNGNLSLATAASLNSSSSYVIKHKLVYKDGANLMGEFYYALLETLFRLVLVNG